MAFTSAVFTASAAADDLRTGLPALPQASQPPALEQAFRQPSDEAKPWVYWYWMNANVTREGITRDLEAMAETGIGGAYVFTIGGGGKLVASPANALTEPWWELVIHATKEAGRLGLHLALNACDGWALAGGKWIPPELSMQKITMSTRLVEGGKPFVSKLDQPPALMNDYRDIAVLAYPFDEGADQSSIQLKPKATTNMTDLDLHAGFSHAPSHENGVSEMFQGGLNGYVPVLPEKRFLIHYCPSHVAGGGPGIHYYGADAIECGYGKFNQPGCGGKYAPNLRRAKTGGHS